MKSILKLSITGILASLLLAQCNAPKSTESSEDPTSTDSIPTPSLTLVWETSDSLPTNESVLFDEKSGILYVSNIGGLDPQAKDGKGSIAMIDQSGKILNPSWIKGLNSPKGMGISNGKLYVTDIDELIEIDLATAKILKKQPVAGAQFLNDVAIFQDNVYFTDMNTGKVHLLEAGKITTISEGNESINGIAIDAEGTIFGLDASGLKKWNADGTTSIINSNVTGGDGLVILGDGNFIASRWQGEIWFANDSTQTLLLDTKAAESNTADIGYIPSEKLILVPTFFKNKVAAYKLDY
jgi:hypothetical protein